MDKQKANTIIEMAVGMKHSEWPIKHPMLPIWLSIAAIAAATILPIIRSIQG